MANQQLPHVYLLCPSNTVMAFASAPLSSLSLPSFSPVSRGGRGSRSAGSAVVPPRPHLPPPSLNPLRILPLPQLLPLWICPNAPRAAVRGTKRGGHDDQPAIAYPRFLLRPHVQPALLLPAAGSYASRLQVLQFCMPSLLKGNLPFRFADSVGTIPTRAPYSKQRGKNDVTLFVEVSLTIIVLFWNDGHVTYSSTLTMHLAL